MPQPVGKRSVYSPRGEYTNVALADEIGVSEPTVRRARQAEEIGVLS